MCWSPLVSGMTALLHLLTLLSVRRWEYRIFLPLFAAMEGLQMIQHLTLSFPLLNMITTCLAYLLIWLQPVAFSLFSRNRTLITLSLITLIWADRKSVV